MKHGKYGNTQRFRCKGCGKTFRGGNIMPSKQVPPDQVGAAIDMYYDGLSYRDVARNIASTFNVPQPSPDSVYRWVRDHSRRVIDRMRKEKAHTGSEWVADEMVVNVGGRKYWLWNVMDARTRYILAAHLTLTRNARDAKAVFQKAKDAAANLPKTIKTDRLRSYIPAIEDLFGANAKHIQSDGIAAPVNNNLSERLQGTFRERIKVLRGLEARESAQAYLDGWVLDYNLFRPHESLGNATPAERARIRRPFTSWQEAVGLGGRPPLVESRSIKKNRRVLGEKPVFKRG